MEAIRQSRKDTYDAHVDAQRKNQSPPMRLPKSSRWDLKSAPLITMSKVPHTDKYTDKYIDKYTDNFDKSSSCEAGKLHPTHLQPGDARRNLNLGEQTDKKNDDAVLEGDSFRTNAKLRRAVVMWSAICAFGSMVVIGLVLGMMVA